MKNYSTLNNTVILPKHNKWLYTQVPDLSDGSY